MTIMHHLLAGALRFAGRFRDAAEVEAAAQPAPARRLTPAEFIPPSEPLPSTPAIVSYEAEHGAHGATSPESGSASSPAPQAGGDSGSIDSTVAQAGTAGSGGSLGGSQTDSRQGAHAEHDDPEHAEDHGHQQDSHSHHALPTPESHALRDPLDGIYSERFRARLEREAFAGASETAKDSAIVQTADRLLPAEVRSLLQHDVPNIDISTVARSARIEGLGGEMPAWAQLELFKDPAHDRSVEAAAFSEHSTHAPIRQPEISPASAARTSSRSHELER